MIKTNYERRPIAVAIPSAGIMAHTFWKACLALTLWVGALLITGPVALVGTAVTIAAALRRRHVRESNRLSYGYSSRRGRRW